MQYLQATFAVVLGSKEFREGYAKIDWSVKTESNNQAAEQDKARSPHKG